MNEQEAREIIDSQEQEIARLEADIERIRKNNISFVKLVAKTRELQKSYFKTRSTETLHQSKALETRLDQTLERYMTAIIQIENADGIEILKENFDTIIVDNPKKS